jgi:gliding motility-associated lipoprotein GldD
MIKVFALAFVAVFISGCNSEYTFKQRGYYKIDFPEKSYQTFNEPGFPYSFEYPVYGRIVKDTSFFEDAPENPYWINIDFPQFEGRIYLSYKEIGKNNFEKLVNDAFTMSYKQHTYKASSIEPTNIQTPYNIPGVYFTLTGNTATANQFFLSDSTRHFLRGALYFDAAPNADSLSIVNNYLKADMQHLINTLQWK